MFCRVQTVSEQCLDVFLLSFCGCVVLACGHCSAAVDELAVLFRVNRVHFPAVPTRRQTMRIRLLSHSHYYTWLHVSICIYIRTHVHTSIYIYVHVCVHIYVCTCTYSPLIPSLSFPFSLISSVSLFSRLFFPSSTSISYHLV